MMISWAVVFLALAANPSVDHAPEFRYRWPEEHWANDLTEDAKRKFAARYRQFPCEKISQYASDLDDRAIYWAIRDAGIFKDPACSKYFKSAMGLPHFRGHLTI